jgi:hypothetical protein
VAPSTSCSGGSSSSSSSGRSSRSSSNCSDDHQQEAKRRLEIDELVRTCTLCQQTTCIHVNACNGLCNLQTIGSQVCTWYVVDVNMDRRVRESPEVRAMSSPAGSLLKNVSS